MKVNKWLIPTLALALLLGTVGIAQATGWWLVSGREMVNLEQLTGGADVKGWMTLEQVAGGIGMETAALIAKLGLPADIPPATALKDLEGVTAGFEVTTVRAVVDEVLGLAPAAGTEEAPTQAPTTPAPTVAAEQMPSLAAATLAPTEVPTPTAVPAPAATAAHTAAGDGSGAGAGEGEGETPPAVTSAMDIKGRHTLQEIVDATGVDLAELLAALTLPLDTDPQTAVRDLVEAGLVTEVDQVRAAVAELQ